MSRVPFAVLRVAMRHTITAIVAAALALVSLAATPAEAGSCMKCSPTLSVTDVPLSDAPAFMALLDIQITGGDGHNFAVAPYDTGRDSYGHNTWSATPNYPRLCRTSWPFDRQIFLTNPNFKRWPGATLHMKATTCGKGVDCKPGSNCGASGM